MKKIIAILLALAVVSMAFAQTVSIQNTVSTEPQVTIDGGNQYWGFANNFFLREQVVGEAITADGRARVKGRIRFDLQTIDPYETSILSFKPRWSWNSASDAADGNRSVVGASLKPWDFLQIDVGNLGDTYAFGLGPSLSGQWTEPWTSGFAPITGIAGGWENIHNLIGDGIEVLFTGVDNLKIGVGLKSAGGEKRTMIKKGMFNGFALGAKFDSEFFEVGAKYAGNFGATAKKADSTELMTSAQVTAAQQAGTAYASSLPSVSVASSNTAAGNDKAYQDHTIYAGFTFKGLQEAKVGTTIDAEVGFYTQKKSLVAATEQATAFLFGAGAGFNFRNGIKDDVHVLVGYVKSGSDSAKVLPFAITNVISYTVDSDATFSFKLTYAQNGLKEKKSATASDNTNYYYNTMSGIQVLDANGNVTTAGAKASPRVSGDYGWLIGAKPEFSWTMGASKFSIGVKAVTLGDIVPHAKNGWEWSWTGLRGRKAVVSFPLSWTYTF